MWRDKYFFCGHSSIAPSRDWYAVRHCIMCVYMKPYYYYEVAQHSVSLKHFTSCDSKRYSASCVHTYVCRLMFGMPPKDFVRWRRRTKVGIGRIYLFNHRIEYFKSLERKVPIVIASKIKTQNK